MISSPVLDGYRLCHVRELIFNSTESLCLFGRGYETDYKNAHTQTSGLSPVWAAGSFSLLQKDRYLYLQGLCNGYKIQRNGLGMSNSRNLQGVTQMDLVKDEMGQQGRGLWEPHRTSLAFLQRFHQTESRFTLHAHTHGLIYQSFSKVVCKCFHRTNQKKILPDL